MIQENYRVVAFRELRPFKFGQAQPPIRFAQEAVIYIVRVGVNSGHGPVRGNGPPKDRSPPERRIRQWRRAYRAQIRDSRLHCQHTIPWLLHSY